MAIQSPQPAANLEQFNLGVASTPTPALPNSVLWLAKDLGYYQREGLDVNIETLQGTPLVVAGLLSGELDIGNIGTDDVLRVVASQGVDMRDIHSPDPRQYFMIVGNSSIGSVKDLPGKTYGVAQRGSLDDTLSRTVLTKLGVDPSSLDFLTVGDPSTRAKVLIANQVDATTLSIGTWVTIQDQTNVKPLVNVDDYFNAAPVVAKVDAATGKEIQQKPTELREFTAAIMQASRDFANSEDLWVNAMAAERPDVDRTQLEDLWQAFRASWAVNGYMNLTQDQLTADYYYDTPPFQDVSHIGVDQWTDTQFADSFIRQNGLDNRMDDPGRTIN